MNAQSAIMRIVDDLPGFQRNQVKELKERLLEPPNRLIAVVGPRQTGKTTAVKQALAQIPIEQKYVAVDHLGSRTVGVSDLGVNKGDIILRPSAHDEQWLVNVWERYRLQTRQVSPQNSVLVLDEIQKIDNWSSVIKGLWDADRANDCSMHVVILSSAPLLMKEGLNESLMGRFEQIRFTHWSYGEMSEAFGFNLEEYVYFGGYPGAVSLINEYHRWNSYVKDVLAGPNIERDVLAMTRVDKPALLKQLFEVGVESSGRIVSYNKLLGHLQDAGNTTTLTRYLKLLSDAGLLTGLEKYSRGLSSKASTPKLNVLNTAFMSAYSDYEFEEALADRTFWGRLVESAVGAHLLNTASTNVRVRYWRRDNHEVDFVLQTGSKRTVAIEVKTRKNPTYHQGLSKFKQRYHPCNSFLVGPGGVPLHEFLLRPAGHWFKSS